MAYSANYEFSIQITRGGFGNDLLWVDIGS